MKLKVNPTRMELLKLRKRMGLAQRGHKLLRDKEEQLLVEFRKLINEIHKQRTQAEKNLLSFYTIVLQLRALTDTESWNEILETPGAALRFSSTVESTFNIPHTKIHVESQTQENHDDNFSNPSCLYVYRKTLEMIQELCSLVQMEDKLRHFAEEIDRTRRRVNALEYVLIPNLEETIKFITFKLSEAERGSLVRLKHIQLIKGL